MTRRRGVALSIGIVIAASYLVAVAGILSYGLPLLRLTRNPDALLAVAPELISGPAFVIGVASEFVILGLVLGHVVHAARAPQLSSARRALWLGALILGSVVAVPF